MKHCICNQGRKECICKPGRFSLALTTLLILILCVGYFL